LVDQCSVKSSNTTCMHACLHDQYAHPSLPIHIMNELEWHAFECKLWTSTSFFLSYAHINTLSAIDISQNFLESASVRRCYWGASPSSWELGRWPTAERRSGVSGSSGSGTSPATADRGGCAGGRRRRRHLREGEHHLVVLVSPGGATVAHGRRLWGWGLGRWPRVLRRGRERRRRRETWRRRRGSWVAGGGGEGVGWSGESRGFWLLGKEMVAGKEIFWYKFNCVPIKANCLY
jgi:hypothetical protein